MNLGLYSEEGDTYLVEIFRRYNSRAVIRKLMTADGTLTDLFEPEDVPANMLVSDRPLRNISPKTLYHFSSPRVGYKLKAASFVTHGRPLVSTCSHGLGSGIYGLYITTQDELVKLRDNPEQIIYRITLNNPLIIQDTQHLHSLISASMATNRYVDDLIARLNPATTYRDIMTTVRQDNINNLTLLWEIVFARSPPSIKLDQNWLTLIISNYVFEYFNDTTLRDTQSNMIIHELPINHIMRAFEYDGLLGDDKETNSWGRGNVSFDYSSAEVLEGHGSRCYLA